MVTHHADINHRLLGGLLADIEFGVALGGAHALRIDDRYVVGAVLGEQHVLLEWLHNVPVHLNIDVCRWGRVNHRA